MHAVVFYSQGIFQGKLPSELRKKIIDVLERKLGSEEYDVKDKIELKRLLDYVLPSKNEQRARFIIDNFDQLIRQENHIVEYSLSRVVIDILHGLSDDVRNKLIETVIHNIDALLVDQRRFSSVPFVRMLSMLPLYMDDMQIKIYLQAIINHMPQMQNTRDTAYSLFQIGLNHSVKSKDPSIQELMRKIIEY